MKPGAQTVVDIFCKIDKIGRVRDFMAIKNYPEPGLH